MKKRLLCLCFLACCLAGGHVRASADGEVKVSRLDVAKNEKMLFISMEVDPSGVKIPADGEVVCTPVLVSENESASLPAIRIAGRNRYYRHLRNEKKESELRNLYRAGKNEIISYQASVPYEQWMETAELMIKDSRCGCLSRVLSENRELLATLDFAPKKPKEPKKFVPLFVYVRPVAEASVKTREVKGKAYIDFPVNKVEIHEDYRNNAAELRKIFVTIDSVKNDPDAVITSVTIKGYASPEGRYALNERLAKGRTDALMRHVQKLYSFPANVIHSDYEPEDWEGLRKYVESSDLPHRKQILDIIDGTLAPDPKEWKLKSTYPEEYRGLLRDCYPALRHSDYAVDYTVRSYTEVEEMKRIMRRRPGNLSLNEFYTIALSYEPGSAEYDEVFNTMVRVYPDDETANLNAANVAMSHGDRTSARRFLDKAGNSGEANYARGIFAATEGDYAAARGHFAKARQAGVTQAGQAIKQLDEIEKYN